MAKSPSKKPPWAGGPGGPKDQPMGITYSAGTGTIINSAAKNGTLGAQPSPQQANEIEFDTSFATNNGQIGTASFIGRLVILRLNQANEETRLIVSNPSGNLCTVHEDWLENPAAGDTYHIAYNLADADTLGGISLLTKRNNDYAATREFTVGTGAAFAFFALVRTSSLELDNNNNPTTGSPQLADFIVKDGARFQNGYLAAGKPVSGGYMTSTSTGVGNYVTLFYQRGAQVKLYDYLHTSVYAQNVTRFGQAGAVPSPVGYVICNRAKFYRLLNLAIISMPVEFTDTTLEGDSTGTTAVEVLQMGSNWADYLTINSLTMVNMQGWSLGNDNLALSPIPQAVFNLPNITWAQVKVYVYFNSDYVTVNFIDNSNFTPDTDEVGETALRNSIDFTGISGTTVRQNAVVNEQYSVQITMSLPGVDGYSANGRIFVFDEASDAVVIDSDTNASPVVPTYDTFTYRDISANGTNISTYTRAVNIYGPFSAQLLHYGYVPQVYDIASTEKFVFNAFMVEDALQTGTAAAALAAVGSPEPVITRHGTGETDPRPMKFLYINQQITSKRGLAVGDVLYATASSPTPGSPAPTGTVLAIISNNGDLTAAEESNGWVLLGDWNGVEFEEFSNVETQTSPAFQGIIELGNRSPDFAVPNAVYQEYTMEVNANGASLADTYRFIIAALCENPHTRAWTDTVLGWMLGEQPYLLDYDNGNGKFQTQRNAALLEGVFVHNYGAGNVNYLTADDGTTWAPPTTATVTFTNLQPNTEVRLFRTDTMAELGTGTENSGTSVDVTYPVDIESPLLTAYAVLFSITYEPVYIEGIELDGTNQSIPIVQRFDRNYKNP